jgi:hypothetical protein
MRLHIASESACVCITRSNCRLSWHNIGLIGIMYLYRISLPLSALLSLGYRREL